MGVASKLGGVAEGLSKDELSKLEEMKVQRLQHFGSKFVEENSINTIIFSPILQDNWRVKASIIIQFQSFQED